MSTVVNTNLPELDVEAIKSYNEMLKKTVAKAAKIKTELEFNIKELNKICKELSSDLGVEVNSENIESIYIQLVDKINSNLEVGMDILNRINQEDSLDSNEINI
jgi:uncharacterized FlaG/YvyC family protein